MLRMTRQRQAVRDALKADTSFRSAQQVHEDLRKAGTPIGLATVYRTLQNWAEKGELDTARNPEGEACYRLCEQLDHHHHIICRTCGHSEDIELDDLEETIELLGKEHSFAEVSHSLEIYGLCANCS
ncbi:MAG: transcriptional repressor [Actinomycetaceae bacterium]|nr:transcriptional repressor [Actinomycetaceae bacterium]